jgi:hypothetical protein
MKKKIIVLAFIIASMIIIEPIESYASFGEDVTSPVSVVGNHVRGGQFRFEYRIRVGEGRRSRKNAKKRRAVRRHRRH